MPRRPPGTFRPRHANARREDHERLRLTTSCPDRQSNWAPRGRSRVLFPQPCASGTAGGAMTDVLVDQAALRAQVQQKYREVALEPDAEFHFHTGRSLAARLGYDAAVVDRLPDRPSSPSPESATRSRCARWSRASAWSTSAPAPDSTPSSPPTRSGPTGRVIGVDMTPEMLAKSRRTVDRARPRPRRVPRGAGRSSCRSRTAGPTS